MLGADPHPSTVKLTARQSAEVAERVRRSVDWACPRALRGQEEDLAQSASLRVFSVLADGRELNASYIKRVVHSVIIDEIRRRRVRPVDSEDPSQLVRFADPNSSTPGQRAADAEIGRAIRQCLDQAAESRRRALVLHLVGHTGAEVAEMMGVSAKSAENLVYRGLAALRSCLDALGFRP